MIEYLKRLARTGAAYTTSSIVAKLIAVFTLPIYTRHVAPSDFGQAETLAVTVIVLSILFRFGAVESVVRFYFLDEYDRRDVVRTGFWGLLMTVTAGSAACFALANPIAELLLRGAPGSTTLVQIAAVWLWFATFYELLLALFRVEERSLAYITATVSNVVITIPLTVWLVVVEDEGAKGLLLGNATGTAVVVVALIAIHARTVARPGLPLLMPMLRFGLPTVPGEVSLYALNFVDRILLVQLPSSRSAGLAAAALYSIAVKFAQGVTIFVRAFQLAWPPLAYSIKEDTEARVVYGRVLTYYLLITGGVVAALTLVSRWLARLLVADPYFESYRAVPLVATGVVLYGAYLVLVSAVARMGKTGSLFPVAAAGLAVNIGLGFWLIPDHGITGAGIALIGAYLVLLTLMYVRARMTLGLVLEWTRILHITAAALLVSFSGEYLLPEDGAEGLLLRVAWWLIYPAALLATGFFSREELKQLRSARQLLKRARDSKSLDDRPDLMEQMHGPE